jgi:hypothetical protein
MPSPPGLEGHPCLDGRAGSNSGPSLGPGLGACAARAAEIPTKATRAHQSRQRLGRPKRHRLPVRLDDAWRAASPNGEPQRAQTMRPAKLRSALTAQLPQLGQAIAPHPLESMSMLTPLLCVHLYHRILVSANGHL